MNSVGDFVVGASAAIIFAPSQFPQARAFQANGPFINRDSVRAFIKVHTFPFPSPSPSPSPFPSPLLFISSFIFIRINTPPLYASQKGNIKMISIKAGSMD
jgi:hypothetical protein